MSYQAEAAVTESPHFHADLVKLATFEKVIAESISALRRLDKIKKTLFYGKTPTPNPQTYDSTQNVRKVPGMFRRDMVEGLDERTAVRVIHGVVGIATEACEMLELLFSVISEHKPFDPVNVSEECGDTLWYIACCLNALGFTFEEVQSQNIAKLRARYPNKFTEYDAVNRNLTNERTVLETTSVTIDAKKRENEPIVSAVEIREFCGYLTAALPELYKVHPNDVWSAFREYAKRTTDRALQHLEQRSSTGSFIKDVEAGIEERHAQLIAQASDITACSTNGTESSGDLLKRLGTDGDAWAKEFVERVDGNYAEAGQTQSEYTDIVRGWFSCAIESGRTAGYWKGRREVLHMSAKQLGEAIAADASLDSNEVAR